MANDFGLKVGIDGEADFKRALKSMNDEMKTLGTEAKLVASQFDSNDKSVKALSATNEALNKQIDAQNKKVDLLKDALENAKKQYGENSTQVTAWQQKLNLAQAELNEMSRNLEKNKEAIEKAAEAEKEAADGTGEFGDAIEETADKAEDGSKKFNVVKGSLTAIGVAITAAAAAVTAAAVSMGKALVDMAKDGAKYADQILTESSVTGIATDKLQEYQYAAELVDVSLETLTGSMTKNIRSMKSAQDGTKTAVEAYEKLGISITDANGELRDGDEVYWELIDALGKLDNETERDALAMTLLGRSARELNPLIKAGSDTMDDLAKKAQDAGYVMSDETLNAFGKLDDQLQYLSSGATAAKNALGTVLLPVLTDLAGTGVNLLGEFTNGVKDANGDISKIGDVIGDLLPQIFEAIVQYVPQIVELSGQVIEAFGSALLDPKTLNNILKSAGKVMKSLASALLKSLPEITKVAVKTIIDLCKFLLSADNIRALTSAAIEIVTTIASGIGEALPELIPAIVEAIMTIVDTLLDPANLTLLLNAVLQIISGISEGIIKSLPEIIDSISGIIDGVIEFLTTPETIGLIFDAGEKLLGALVDAVPDIAISLARAVPDLITSIVNGLLTGLTTLADTGFELINAIWEGMWDGSLAHDIGDIFDNLFTKKKKTGNLGMTSGSPRQYAEAHGASTDLTAEELKKFNENILAEKETFTLSDRDLQLINTVSRMVNVANAVSTVPKTVDAMNDKALAEISAKLMEEQNDLLKSILDKPTVIAIGDEEIAKAYTRYSSRRGLILNGGAYVNAN